MKHLLNSLSKAALVLSGAAVLGAWLACSGSDGNASSTADCAPDEVEACDCAVIVTHHPGLDFDKVLATAPLVVDFRGVTRGKTAPNLVRL